MSCLRKFLVIGLMTSLAGVGTAMLQAAAQQSPASQGAGQTAGQAADQAPSLRKQNPEGRIRTTVSLVIVPVTVKTASGNLVTDLVQNDFRVFEDGIEQPIAEFSVEPFPLSAAILIDDDLKQSTAEKVQKSLQTLAGGFSSSDLSDEVSLWRFDDVPELVSEDFISDNDALLTKLKRIDLSSSFPGVGSAPMTGGPKVNTSPQPGPLQIPSIAHGHPNNKHINDAIYAAADELRDRAPERRKIIFLISDGQNAKNNTHSYDETIKLLLSQEISVYAVGVGEANLNRGITFLGNNILAKYAHATGGDIFYGQSREDLEALYARVCEQARNQYTIAYSGAKTDRSKPYHAIEVRVKRPGLNLLTRDGYYLSDKP